MTESARSYGVSVVGFIDDYAMEKKADGSLYGLACQVLGISTSDETGHREPYFGLVPLRCCQPMTVLYGGVVNIISLIFYFFALCLAILLAVRQGLGHNYPWICIAILSLCRLVQVSIDLAATELYPPDTAANTSLSTGVAILTEIGLTPLFMSTASLLNATNGPKGRRMQWILFVLHIPLVVSLILIVAGGIDPESQEGPTFAATPTTQAGIALYCGCFVILIWATIVITSRLYLATSTELRILTIVVLSLPFYLVNVIYMMCFAFETQDGSQKFNVISGSVTLQLCMQVIMEYIIVGLYLALGLELPDRASRLANRAIALREMDQDQLTGMLLWKVYEAISGEQLKSYFGISQLMFRSTHCCYAEPGFKMCPLVFGKNNALI
jgi:hypothetical protein